MKQRIYIVIVAIGLLSCNKGNGKKVDNNTVDTLQTISQEKVNIDKLEREVDIYIKDKSQYDQTFIDGLSECHESMQLIDNYILILIDKQVKDTIYFPFLEDIQLNKKTVFKGTKNQNNFVLTVTRRNLTSLDYKFQLLDKIGNTIINKSGYATLNSYFFFGAETDIDDESDISYLSVEYWDNSSGSSFAIRVGIDDNDGKLKAKIVFYCNDNKLKNIDLDDCPTLRTK